MAHTQSTDLTTPRQNAKETNNDNLKTNKMSKLEQRKCSIHGKTLVFCTHITQNSSKELQHGVSFIKEKLSIELARNTA